MHYTEVDALIKVLAEKYPVVGNIGRVVGFEGGDDNTVEIVEHCDEWFRERLNADEILQLADFLKELGTRLKENVNAG